MNSKLIFTILFGLGIIVGYNAFLIERDNQLFEAYSQEISK